MEGWRKGAIPLMFQEKMRRSEGSGMVWVGVVEGGGVDDGGGGVEAGGESRRRLDGGGLMSGMVSLALGVR